MIENMLMFLLGLIGIKHINQNIKREILMQLDS